MKVYKVEIGKEIAKTCLAPVTSTGIILRSSSRVSGGRFLWLHLGGGIAVGGEGTGTIASARD